jgi:hypothetical protein
MASLTSAKRLISQRHSNGANHHVSIRAVIDPAMTPIVIQMIVLSRCGISRYVCTMVTDDAGAGVVGAIDGTEFIEALAA